MANIKLDKLTKKFGKVTVVDNLSMEVKDGEFACLLGPQGAGKSTALRLMAGLEKPTSGNIYFDEERVTNLDPSHRDVAMVFQTFALYPHKTVFQNLEFTLMKDKMSKNDRKNRVNEIAEMLRITHLLGKRPVHLSGGERQRVSLGRSLVRKPNVFLLDEPLTNLDAKLRLHMRSELKRIQQEVGQTAIFSTADDIEAITMADKIAVIDRGRLQQYDEVYKVYDDPMNLFTAKFVGTPVINIAECALIEKGEKVLLDFDGEFYDISELKNALLEKVGEDIFFGVRPSDIKVHKKKPAGKSLPATVYEIIPTGDILILALKIREKIIRVSVPPTFKASIGDKFWVTFDMNKVHIFDKKTENAIV